MNGVLPAEALAPRARSGYRVATRGSYARRSEAAVWGLLGLLVVLAGGALALVAGLRPGLALIAGAAGLGVVLGLRRPPLGLFAIGVLCTVDTMVRVYLIADGPLPWNTINYLLIGVAGLGAPILLRVRSGILRLLQAFTLVLVAGLYFSPDRTRGAQDILGVLAVFGLVVYFARAVRYPDVWRWLGLVVGTLGAVIGLAFFLRQDELGYIDPNAWALSSLTALFAIALAYAAPTTRGGGRGRVPLALLAILNSAWVFLSASRGSMLIACLCLLYLLLTTPGLHRRALLLLTSAVIAAGLLSQFGDLQSYAVQRVTKLFDRERSLADRTSHRWSLAVGGWRIFVAHPVIGVGTGGFTSAWRRIPDRRGIPDFRAVGSGRAAHAGWVKVLAENGVVGGGLLALAIAGFAIGGLRRRGRDRWGAGVGLFAGVVLGAIFLSTEYQSKGPWFLAAGALVILHRGDLAAYTRAVHQAARLRARSRP